MPAGATPVDMPTQGGGPTARDGPQDGSLLRTEPRMLRDEGVTLRVEDVGHLHGRPGHGVLVGFRFSRDPGGPRARGPAAAPTDSAPLGGAAATGVGTSSYA